MKMELKWQDLKKLLKILVRKYTLSIHILHAKKILIKIQLDSLGYNYLKEQILMKLVKTNCKLFRKNLLIDPEKLLGIHY